MESSVQAPSRYKEYRSLRRLIAHANLHLFFLGTDDWIKLFTNHGEDEELTIQDYLEQFKLAAQE